MSFFQVSPFIILLLIYKCHSQINQYEQEIGLNGEYIWRSTSDFIPQQSQSYGTIKLGREMSMEFDFIWWGRSATNSWENFFRVGCNASDSDEFPCTGGNGCAGLGARYPSFWIKNNQDVMHVSVSNSNTGSCQPSQTLTDFGSITIGTSYHLKIWFNQSTIIVTANENDVEDSITVQTWSRDGTQSRYLGVDMPLWWMTNVPNDKDDEVPGNGTFSNITIISQGFPTSPPTSDPTPSPTPTPTTAQPSMSPTETPTNFPSASPTVDPTSLPSIPPTTATPTTAEPSVAPSITPTRAQGAVGEDPVTPSPGVAAVSPDQQKKSIDLTTIGLICGCAAIICCLCIGFILYRKKRPKRQSTETQGKEIQREFWAQNTDETNQTNQNNAHQQQPMEIGVIRSSNNGHSNRFSSISRREGAYSPLTNDNSNNPQNEQYLSAAQKKELKRTPGGDVNVLDDDSIDSKEDDVGNQLTMENNVNHHQYLSRAQREELRRRQNQNLVNTNGQDQNLIVVDDSDDDDEVIDVGMGTKGYIGGDDIIANIDHEGVDQDEEISDDIVEHMKTMGDDDDDYDEAEDLYDPASPNAVEQKITIGAESDEDVKYLGDGGYVHNGGRNIVGSPSDDLYAPVGHTIN